MSEVKLVACYGGGVRLTSKVARMVDPDRRLIGSEEVVVVSSLLEDFLGVGGGILRDGADAKVSFLPGRVDLYPSLLLVRAT